MKPRRRFPACLGLALVLTLARVPAARAEEGTLARFVKASLVFREESDAAKPYPHVLRVFLRLDNVHDAGVSWSANLVEGIEAELLDAADKPVPPPPTVASVPSSVAAFFLPRGSRLDWLVSHGGVSMVGDFRASYALIVGGRGWLVPVRTAGAYRLRVRLRGSTASRAAMLTEGRAAGLLLDLAPAKVEVTP